MQQDELTQVARQEADRIIDQALGELHEAARKIGIAHRIPEDIGGLSTDELLGRMAYVPSMARDLRRIAGQEIAKQQLENAMGLSRKAATDQPSAPAAPTTSPPVEPSKIPAQVPVGLDLVDLDGVTTQTVRALKAAGLKTVGDVVVVPDEHLLKIDGIAEKSLGQLRTAISKASGAPA